MQFSLGWNRAGAQTPALILSSRLQDRNFTQRGPRKSIEDDFMGKRRNCEVNEHFYTVQRGNPLECKCFDLMILECLYCRSIHLHKDHQSKHRYMEVVD